MALYKRGNIWWVSFWRRGKHIQKSTGLNDKRAARAVEQSLVLAKTALDGSGGRSGQRTVNDEGRRRGIVLGLLRAVYGDDSDRTSLNSLWDEYLEVLETRGKRLGARSLNEKRCDFQRFINWAREKGVSTMDEVDASVARRFSLHLAEQMAAKRRSNLISEISSVWNALLPSHPGVANPWPQVTPVIDAKRTTRIGFSSEEERRVMEAARAVNPQWFVACTIGRYTGLRYGDVCRLTWGNLDMRNRTVCVCPHKTKYSSGVLVRIPMSGRLFSVLEDWLAHNPRATEFDRVLPWLQERSPSRNKKFRVVLTRAGIDPTRYSFHSWRHTLATRLGEAGASTEVRKRILGHTTDVMAERYNHADLTDELRSVLERS